MFMPTVDFGGHTVASQNNEDEIIKDIFLKIGIRWKRFVEFGCGDGRQNNTIELLKSGWHGVWYEPHKRRRLSAVERWKGWPVVILRKQIVPKNINRLVTGNIDFLSIDIDGGDYDVWAALIARPRLVCIEVGDPRGRSLADMQGLATLKGYRYVCASGNGVNAFFIAGAE